MRLRTYHGASLSDVMQVVRKELGDDALIVSTLEGENGVKVTAALELETLLSAPPQESSPDTSPENEDPYTLDEFCGVLKYHGVSESILTSLIQAFSPDEYRVSNSLDLWEKSFSYSPLDFTEEAPNPQSPVMLIGSPGVGKSVTLAKLAAQAVLGERDVTVLTCDPLKAGAVSQLETYCKALGLELKVAPTNDDLKQALKSAEPEATILIDTPGLNTQDPQDIHKLAEKIISTKLSPIWVCGAGEHTDETLEKMDVLQTLGCKRLIISKLDTTKRVCGALSASLDKEMSLVGFSNSPMVGDEIIPANSQTFSDLLTLYGDDNREDFDPIEKRKYS